MALRKKKVLLELGLILHFSMLAACTIGPGTVIVCSKSGADYGLKLTWALVVASFVAFVLQEGAARLSIVSGAGLGQAMRIHFGALQGPGQTPLACSAIAVGVIVGNTAYECNNLVGAVEALYALGMPDDELARFLASFATGLVTVGILLGGNVDLTSRALGVVVVLMVSLFLTSAVEVGIDGQEFAEGLLPTFPSHTDNGDSGSSGGNDDNDSDASNSAVTVLAMVATTAIPFNSFLASAAAEGFELPEMRRGIAFSTAAAGLLSFFIVATGSGIDSEFTVKDVVETLKDTEGSMAGSLFGLGLYAAAFSSAISVALGVSLTCQALLGYDHTTTTSSTAAAAAAAATTAGHRPEGFQPSSSISAPTTTITANPLQSDEHATATLGAQSPPPLSPSSSPSSSPPSPSSSSALAVTTAAAVNTEDPSSSPSFSSQQLASTTTTAGNNNNNGNNGNNGNSNSNSESGTNKRHESLGPWADDGVNFKGAIVACVAAGVVVGASGLNTVAVVFAAQVVNGLLLPCVATCLLVCLNDQNLMRSRPVTSWDNARLGAVVAVTVFLAANTVVGYAVSDHNSVLIGSLVVMACLLIPIAFYVHKIRTKDLPYLDLNP